AAARSASVPRQRSPHPSSASQIPTPRSRGPTRSHRPFGVRRQSGTVVAMSGTSHPSKVLADLLVRVDHVGIATADLDGALAFYCDTLGFELRHREENADQRVTEAMIAPPAGPDGTQLQLL